MYRDTIVRIATELIGAPSMRYVSERPDLGQLPDEGFDCSGFVTYVLKKAGLFIPDYTGQDGKQRPTRHANELWDTYGIAVDRGLQQPGDVIFFSRNGTFPTHTGIVCSKTEYVHAPGVNESQVEVAAICDEDIARKGLGRQLYARNPIGFKSPVRKVDSPTYRYHQQPIE